MKNACYLSLALLMAAASQAYDKSGMIDGFTFDMEYARAPKVQELRLGKVWQCTSYNTVVSEPETPVTGTLSFVQSKNNPKLFAMSGMYNNQSLEFRPVGSLRYTPSEKGLKYGLHTDFATPHYDNSGELLVDHFVVRMVDDPNSNYAKPGELLIEVGHKRAGAMVPWQYISSFAEARDMVAYVICR